MNEYNFLNKVRKFIVANGMIAPNDTVVIGVSGGADSVCLLLVLKSFEKEFNLKIHAVHVNHGIRGIEADEDEEFVRKMCEKENVIFESFHIDANAIAKENRLTVEEAGRLKRYEIFNAIIGENNGKIAVAHHMNDDAETVLMNMFRGSSLNGLKGIVPVRDNIIRPLLCVTRQEIEQFLEQRKQKFCIDSTNLSNDYLRNKIRNVVIPFVEKEINKNVCENICALSKDISESIEFINEIADECYNKCVKGQEDRIEIDVNELKKYHKTVKKVVIKKALEHLSSKSKDIYKTHIESIAALENSNVGTKADVAYNIRAQRDYEKIIIVIKKEIKNTEKTKEAIAVKLENTYDLEDAFGIKYKMKFSIIENHDNYNEKNDYTKIIDYDKIKDSLQIRTRKVGDFIQVNSDGGTKKLKDYMINEKIPANNRDDVVLLADGSHIIWAVGYRISEFYKVSETTKTMLKCELIGK